MKRMKVNMDSDFMYIKRLFNGINCSYSKAGDYFYIEEKEILEQTKLNQRHLRFYSADLCRTYFFSCGHKYTFSNLLIEKKYKNMLNFKVCYEREWHDRFFKLENFYNVFRDINIEDERFFYKSDWCDRHTVTITIPTDELYGRMVIKDTFVSGLYIPYNGEKLYLRDVHIRKNDYTAYLAISFSSYAESFLRGRDLVTEEEALAE